jgi:cell volume regulation protein A
VHPAEPAATSWLFVTVGALLVAAIVAHRLSRRLKIPLFLLSLGVGMAAGSDGLGGIAFDDYRLAFRVGCAALAFILFDGGLNTRRSEFRAGFVPGALLATVGVVLTALLVALPARALGFGWDAALLLGAVVSSTDAAAVFSMLRGSGLTLRPRTAATLEVESGLNDPVAVLLTLAGARALAGGAGFSGWEPLEIAGALAIGGAAGYGFGKGAAWLLVRMGLGASGLFTVLSTAIVLLAFGLPTLFWGSGFLAVYVAGIVLGDARLPQRPALVRFHDGAAWLCQVAMFVLLGLLVFPRRMLPEADAGLALGLFLVLVARPIAVALCLAPLGWNWRETLFTGLLGLRGAVPIVLATIPVFGGVSGSERLFHLVFFIVLVSAMVPGPLLPWLARRLGVARDAPPLPRAVLEIHSSEALDGDVLSFQISPALAVAGAAISELPLPDDTSVLLVVRGRSLVPPRGSTVLEPGDHVYLFAREHDRALLNLLFGSAEVESEGE